MTKLIPYPLAEPVSSKEGWEAGIKEKRQTDQRGRGKMGPLPATFLIPVLWLGDSRCSAQEAHPLPALPSSTHTEKPGQKETEDPGLQWGGTWGRMRHHPGCYRSSGQGSRHPSTFPMKQETGWGCLVTWSCPVRSLKYTRKLSFWRQHQHLHDKHSSEARTELS